MTLTEIRSIPTGAGECGEERAPEDCDQPQTPGVVADEGLGDGDDPHRQAAAFHQRAREDEQRDGQQRERLHPHMHGLGERHERDVDEEVADDDAGIADRHVDRAH